MTISEKGIELVKRFEGFSPKIYLCPAGYPTIGYGHIVLDSTPMKTISEEEAERLLVADLSKAGRAVERFIKVPLTQNQFDALCDFTFNLGAGALQRSSLRQKLNRGEYLDAAQEFKKWIYAGGRILKGLVLRRKAEEIMFLEGLNG